MGDQDSRLRLTSSNKKKVSGSHEESEANIAQKGTYYFAQWIDKSKLCSQYYSISFCLIFHITLIGKLGLGTSHGIRN